MSKADNDNWKTPLGVYERAIAEIRNIRQEFQEGLQLLKEIKLTNENLKAELSATKAELQVTKGKLEATKAELQATKEKFEVTMAELQASNDRLENNDTKIELKNVKANLEISKIEARTELENLKAEINSLKSSVVTIYETASNLPLEELIWLKQNYSLLKRLFGR